MIILYEVWSPRFRHSHYNSTHGSSPGRILLFVIQHPRWRDGTGRAYILRELYNLFPYNWLVKKKHSPRHFHIRFVCAARWHSAGRLALWGRMTWFGHHHSFSLKGSEFLFLSSSFFFFFIRLFAAGGGRGWTGNKVSAANVLCFVCVQYLDFVMLQEVIKIMVA